MDVVGAAPDNAPPRGTPRRGGRQPQPLDPRPQTIQGYLAHENTPPPWTLHTAYAYDPMVVLGWWAFSYKRGTPVDPGP